MHVNVPASQLKLVVHRCHVNKLNIHNQVRGCWLGKGRLWGVLSTGCLTHICPRRCSCCNQ